MSEVFTSFKNYLQNKSNDEFEGFVFRGLPAELFVLKILLNI